MCLINEISKFFEEIRSVAWARCGLRVVLDGENGIVAVAHSLDGIVVEIDVRHLNVAGKCIAVGSKSMVLRGDGNFP